MLIRQYTNDMLALSDLRDICEEGQLYNALLIIRHDATTTLAANIGNAERRFIEPALEDRGIRDIWSYVRVATSDETPWNDADEDGYIIEHVKHHPDEFNAFYTHVAKSEPLVIPDNIAQHAPMYAHLAASLTETPWYLLDGTTRHLTPSVRAMNDVLYRTENNGITCERVRATNDDDPVAIYGDTEGLIVRENVTLSAQTHYVLDTPEEDVD